MHFIGTVGRLSRLVKGARPWNLAIAVGLLAIAPVGCGDDGVTGGSDEITVSAAASLREVFPSIDPAPRYNFAGSDQLATQIREGAPVDVYAAANATLPKELFAAGLVERPVTFATNRLVILVPKDNPAGIRSVGDTARPGVRVVVAGEGVPAGDYTRRVLATLKLDGTLRNVVSNETDVRGVVGKVAAGEADAGFVYATDTAAAGDAVRAIELPPSGQTPIEYQIAVVASSTRTAAARAFVAAVTGPEGQAVLTRAGFGAP
jgi:molybdate transport system substrate-binding protein